MPEGHSIRRLADLHVAHFTGAPLKITSPQGRFENEAAAINGREMTGASTHGKHLFLHFEGSIVHVHLGLYGWFRLYDSATDAKTSVRLRLDNGLRASDLSGPTVCKLIDSDDMIEIIERLGPDPLHSSAMPDIAWAKIKKSKKTIAELLMDQSVIAGIGNIYRAEILFFAKQYPYTKGCDISRDAFDTMWTAAVVFLRAGARYGTVNTVAVSDMTPGEIDTLGPQTQMMYVYGQAGTYCRICKTTTLVSTVAGRKLYWCPRCQS